MVSALAKPVAFSVQHWMTLMVESANKPLSITC